MCFLSICTNVLTLPTIVHANAYNVNDFSFVYHSLYTLLVAFSCSQWKERGLYENRDVQIDPRQVGSLTWVFCDMDSMDGKAVTVLSK